MVAEPLHLAGHDQVFGVDCLEALLPGELLGARPREQHLPRGIDHPAGHPDGIANGAHRGHASHPEVLAVHDGGIEHCLSPAVQNRAGARVERRIVLKQGDRRLHRVERRSATLQRLETEPGGGKRAGLVRFPLFGRNVPGASVHEEGGSGSPDDFATDPGLFPGLFAAHRKNRTTPGTATGIRTPV